MKAENQRSLNKQNKKRKPSIFAILFSLIFFAVIVSWILYWCYGADPNGVIHPAGILEVIIAPIQGFINSASVFIFLFSLGVFLLIINKTKAIDAGIGKLFLKLKGKEVILMVVLMIFFAFLGTTISFCEGSIAFYALLLPVMYASGFDAIVALLVICFGSGVGVLASTINPVLFGVSIGVFDSTLDPGSMALMDGIVWRVVSLIIISAFTIGYVIWYARRIKFDITKSYVYDSIASEAKKFSFDQDAIPELTTKRKAVLGIFLSTFVLLILFSIPWDSTTGSTVFSLIGTQLATWFPYIAGQHEALNPTGGAVIGVSSGMADIGKWSMFEMTFLFFIAAFIVYCIDWKSEKDLFNNILAGFTDFIMVILVISIASGFSVILESTGISTLLVGVLTSIGEGLSPYLFILVIFAFFLLISFVIPSISGFANAVFPSIAPAVVQTGGAVTLSGMTLTFSFASGFINLIAPTAIAFVVGCDKANVSIGTIYKKVWPLMIGILILCIILLLLGVTINMATGGSATPGNHGQIF